MKTFLASSFILSTPLVSAIQEVEASSVQYNDFDANEYWAANMQWMIDEGYISGYINKPHPTTGQYGTWLNPYGELTEGQMLSILLRYKLGVDEYQRMNKEISNPSNFAYYNHYVIAEKLGITTKGSTTNSKFQYEQVTRGQLAQALVSMYYGQSVTLEEAVQFMFMNQITTGTDPSKGATLENFVPDSKLSRAHISTFLKNFHNAKQRGIIDISKSSNVIRKGHIQIQSENATQQQLYEIGLKLWGNKYFLFVNESPQKVGNIMTLYNGHTYGVKTQEEYDAVIKKTNEVINEYYQWMEQTGRKEGLLQQSSYLWSTGFQAKDKNKNIAGWQFKIYYDKGYSYEEALKLYQAERIASEIYNAGGETISTGHELSQGLENAYQHYFNGVIDCDAQSQAVMIGMDMMGFANAIHGETGIHADLYVKYKDDYYKATFSFSQTTFRETKTSSYVTKWTEQKFIVSKY